MYINLEGFNAMKQKKCHPLAIALILRGGGVVKIIESLSKFKALGFYLLIPNIRPQCFMTASPNSK